MPTAQPIARHGVSLPASARGGAVGAGSVALLRDARGGAVPLQRVAARGRLQGLLFELTVEQHYRNAGPATLESVFTFPLPLRAALLRNRLRNQVLKVLSVANPLPLNELREAVRRWHRMQGFAPPRSILEAFCKQLPGIQIVDSQVTADAPPSVEDTLGVSERTMVEVLRENGGVMSRARLEADCVARGLNISTFYVYLGYSSLIERLGEGVYALRGARVFPGQIDELKEAPKGEEPLQDFGWTEDGRVWIAYKMSHSILVSGVVTIPTGLKEVLQGEYSLRGSEGDDFGGFRCRNTQAWSLSKYWRRRGGDDGDPFVVVFSLVDRTASVFLGAENLEDAISGDTLDVGTLEKI